MTLTQNQQKELRQLFESVVDDRFSTLKSEINALRAQVARSVHAGTQNTDAKELADLKADMLEFARQQDEIKRTLNVGRASMSTNSNEIHLSDEDKQKFLPAKLAEFSLDEVLQLEALRSGVSPSDTAEYEAFLGITDMKRREGVKA
jgi:predicted  nucleic acid-binding Zn-ribbon protein